MIVMNTMTLFSAKNSSPKESALLAFLKQYYMLVILILMCLIVGLVQPSFWSLSNISNVLFQTAYIGISACGMTVLIASGLIDLSVAGVIAVSSITVAKILPSTTVEVAVLVALVLGAVFGLINGILVGVVKIAPFIATLGTQYLFLGTAFIMTGGKVIPITSHNFRHITTAKIGNIIPVASIIFLILLLITFLLIKHTYLGRAARSTGSNEIAASLAGISVVKTKILIYVFAGICAALAGIFLAGRLSSTEGNMAMGVEMTIIAAVVVGGTSMRGGRASISGTFIGSIFFAVLSSALNLVGVSSYLQYIVMGVVLILAISFGNRKMSMLEVRGED